MLHTSHTDAKDRAERRVEIHPLLCLSMFHSTVTWARTGSSTLLGPRPLESEEGYGCVNTTGCMVLRNISGSKTSNLGTQVPTTPDKSWEVEHTGPPYPCQEGHPAGSLAPHGLGVDHLLHPPPYISQTVSLGARGRQEKAPLTTWEFKQLGKEEKGVHCDRGGTGSKNSGVKMMRSP